jgi:hypothetical protein
MARARTTATSLLAEIEALRPSKYANLRYRAGRDELPDVAPGARATLKLLYRAIEAYGPLDYLLLGHLARDHSHAGVDQARHSGTLLGGLIYVRQAIRSGHLTPVDPLAEAGEPEGLGGLLELIDEMSELLGEDPARRGVN